MKDRGVKGFSLVEILIIVLIIGIAVALTVPNLLVAQQVTLENICIGNMKQIKSLAAIYEVGGEHITGIGDLVPEYLSEEADCPFGEKGYELYRTSSGRIRVECGNHDDLRHYVNGKRGPSESIQTGRGCGLFGRTR